MTLSARPPQNKNDAHRYALDRTTAGRSSNVSENIQVSGNTVIRRPPSEPAEDVRLKRIEGEPIHLDETGNSEQLRSEIRRQKREPDPITEWKASDDVMPPPGPV